MIKPLDFVMTPKGAIAIVTEVNNNSGNICSISYLGGGNPTGEKSAWWEKKENLKVIDNLPSLLSRNLVHPFGFGKKHAVSIFPITE